MIKNMKMKTLISLGVGIVSLICLTVFGIFIGGRVGKVVEEKAIANMNTSLAGQAGLIELFVADSEKMLMEYASADEITDLLSDPENPEYISAAQSYTERYFSKLDEWEGVYLSNWDTKVLAHSSAGAVGMVTRTGDSLEPYRATMTNAKDGFFNGGAFVSPASGQLIFNLRMAIYDANGEPMGLVGGGPFISGLNKLISETEIDGLQNEQYAILDTSNLIYTYHSDESLIIQPIEDEALLAVIEKVTNGEESGVYNHGGDMIVYKYLPQLKLIITMRDSEAELLADSYAIKNLFIVFVAVTELLIILATMIISKFITGPLNKVTSAVNDLGALSLRSSDAISGYAGKNSEVGKIAGSVSSLTETLQGIVATLSECSASLGDGSEIMMNTVSSLSSCANDNTVTTDVLSSGVNYANHAIQKVNADIGTINEIMASSKSANAERIAAANDMLRGADKMFSDIAKKTEKTESDINISMSYLNALTSINDNVKIIQSIAGQTHLLAINASIEASRAGDAGKGFAVVASEIKNLSANSSGAADAISAVCEEMNVNIENIKSCFGDIISFMKNDIGSIFSNMQEISEKLKSSIEEVNSDMDKMSVIIGNILEETGELDGIVERNEESVDSISSKVQITYSMVQKLDELISKNMATAQNINEIISKFN